MGLYILSFVVDLNKVRQLFSSKDERAFRAICATKTFMGYAQQDFPNSVTTEEALRQIIYGAPYDAQSAHSYGYALISICAYLGVDLSGDNDFKLGYVTDLVDEYLDTDFDISDFLVGTDLFADDLELGLPAIDDFPVVGALPDAALNALHEQLRPLEITDEEIADLLESSTGNEEEKGIAYEAIKSLKDRVDYCKKNQVQLVSFCH